MPQKESRYIEVIGEASYPEEVETLIAHVHLRVQAPRNETALSQIRDLTQRCVSRLLESSIHESELQDGGGTAGFPWWRKDSSAQTAEHTIVVRTADRSRLFGALQSLDGMSAGDREFVSISMKQPVFSTDSAIRLNALRRALQAAREKADLIAAASGTSIRKMIRFEEGVPARRGVGFDGENDENLWDSAFSFGTGNLATEGEPGAVDLTLPSRTVWVRCRVRYEIEPLSFFKEGRTASAVESV